MNGTQQLRSRHILFCNCRGDRIAGDKLAGIETFLMEVHVTVSKLTDLCGVRQEKKEQLAAILTDSHEYLILGCYDRTMRLLMDGFLSEHSAYSFINLIEDEQDVIIEKISDFCGDRHGKPSLSELSYDQAWPSWYPVIDYNRCTACGQCADFCLFGVYEKKDGRVEVTNPKGCKNNCPACARICPSAAIIFPKYKYGGAVGGSEDFDENAEHQRQMKDVENILGDNIYEALQKRKAKRASIIREEAMRKAVSERDAAVKESGKNN